MANKLKKEEAIEAVKNLEVDLKTRNTLLEMLDKNIIEIYRNLDNPKGIEIKLTERGLGVFTNTNTI